jgi:ribulose-phosphate 3-epimerase
MVRKKIEIIPAILEENIEEVKRKFKLVKPYVEIVQVDILDGVFAQGKTIEIGELKGLEEIKGLKIDFHLMVSEPALFVDDCRKVGGWRVIGQVEMMNDQGEFVRMVENAHMLAGLAIDLKTPVEAIEERFLEEIDCVLVMSVKAGESGQAFQKEALEEIKKFRGLSEKHGNFNIAVDGGLNKETVMDCLGAGANQLGITSEIFGAVDVGKAIKELRELVT